MSFAMAHGVAEVVSENVKTTKMAHNNQQQQIMNQQTMQQQQVVSQRKNVGVMGSRRIFAAAFKLKVLDSYRNDIDCRGNQRATARKYGIHRRQIQKWLQCEENLRSSCAESNATTTVTSTGCCLVPVGSGNVVSRSPGSVVTSQDGVIKNDLTTITSSSTSSSSFSLSSSIVNSNNVITSIGVNSISSGTAVSPQSLTTGATVAPPALNLSLARLHGDEEKHQQQLPTVAASRQTSPPQHPHVQTGGISVHHSIRRSSSPTSLQYLQHNNNNNNKNNDNNNQVPSSSSSLPLRGVQASYEKTGSQQGTLQQQQQQQQNSNQRHNRRQQPFEQRGRDDERQIHNRLFKDSDCMPDRKYPYIVNRNTNYDSNDIIMAPSRPTNPDGYYQTLESYHKSSGFISYGHNNNNVKENGLIDYTSSLYRDKRNIGDEAGSVSEVSLQREQTTSFGASFTSSSSSSSSSSLSSSSSSLLLVPLHATTIKSERSSPDSLATPGPCETPGSPESAASMPAIRHNYNDYHLDHHDNLHYNHNNNHNNNASNQLVSRVTVTCSDTCRSREFSSVCAATNTRCGELVNGTNVPANTATAAAITTIAAAAAVAVHSNERTSPPAHVHVSVDDSHTFDSRDSEKRLRESEYQQQEHADRIKVEYEELMRRRRNSRGIKEEIAEKDEIETAANGGNTTGASGPGVSRLAVTTIMKEELRSEMSEREALVDARYNRESKTTNISLYPDYRDTRVSNAVVTSGDCSRPVSTLVRETAETYTSLSSPRAASSSGISTSSSCSDSEIDPLDYSSGSTRNVISDLSRRRSFSLRFKIDVLDAFHNDIAVAGNQRATARKFGINRRQVQKWLGQESELRGEIALRGGDLRQRLGPVSENNESSSIAVDLRTSSTTVSPISVFRSDTELENPSPPLYCCDVGSSSQRFCYYQHGSVIETSEAPLDGCTVYGCGINGSSMGCYQETASQRRSSSGYPESQGSHYSYSPRSQLDNVNDTIDVTTPNNVSPLKRAAYSYEMLPSPKRICLENIKERATSPVSQEQPPQDVPLCLVKPKRSFDTPTMQNEPVTSTVPSPPAHNNTTVQPTLASTKKDAILFKPYLDNPVSKPTDETHHNHQSNHREISPISTHSVIVNNNNNNCHGICNLNEDRPIVLQRDYALELSLRVPVTWRSHHTGYTDFPERVRSAFVRYPTSPHYT